MTDLPYIPEDVQNIILSFVPIKINYIKSLYLTSKKYNDYYFTEMEGLYWKLLREHIGDYHCNLFFSGSIYRPFISLWDKNITDKTIRILEKAMIEFNNRSQNNPSVITKWEKFIIRDATISDETEVRLRKLWTEKLGKKPCNLYIARYPFLKNLEQPSKTKKENIKLASDFIFSFKGTNLKKTSLCPYHVFEYVDKWDHLLDNPKKQNRIEGTLKRIILLPIFWPAFYPISFICLSISLQLLKIPMIFIFYPIISIIVYLLKFDPLFPKPNQ